MVGSLEGSPTCSGEPNICRRQPVASLTTPLSACTANPSQPHLQVSPQSAPCPIQPIPRLQPKQYTHSAHQAMQPTCRSGSPKSASGSVQSTPQMQWRRPPSPAGPLCATTTCACVWGCGTHNLSQEAGCRDWLQGPAAKCHRVASCISSRLKARPAGALSRQQPAAPTLQSPSAAPSATSKMHSMHSQAMRGQAHLTVPFSRPQCHIQDAQRRVLVPAHAVVLFVKVWRGDA